MKFASTTLFLLTLATSSAWAVSPMSPIVNFHCFGNFTKQTTTTTPDLPDVPVPTALATTETSEEVYDYTIAYPTTVNATLVANEYDDESEYNVSWGGTPSTHQRLAQGEVVRLLCVSSKTALETEKISIDDDFFVTRVKEIPVSIDALGNVIPLIENIECTWLTTGKKEYAKDYALIGETAGVLENSTTSDLDTPKLSECGGAVYEGSRYVTTWTLPTDPVSGTYYYIFIVTFDTRPTVGDLVAAKGIKYLRAYGIAYAGQLGASPLDAYLLDNPTHPIYPADLPADGQLLFVSGDPSPSRALAPIQALVVDGKTLTGADLEAYLTPTFSAVATTTTTTKTASEGVTGVTVYPNSPDLCLYTLETSTALTDDPTTEVKENAWIKVSTWLADAGSETTINYDAVVANGTTALVLPKLEGDTTRFYRLVAPIAIAEE